VHSPVYVDEWALFILRLLTLCFDDVLLEYAGKWTQEIIATAVL